MDHKHSHMIIYTAQTQTVCHCIETEGVCFNKAAYVQKKYEESADAFLIVYNWFARQAQDFCPRPPGAELPYWAFVDKNCVDQSGSSLLMLEVPTEQAIFFDMLDWSKVLQLRYLGETPEEERAFQKELAARGLSAYDVMCSSFYPDLKQQIFQSWRRLFRHDAAIKAAERQVTGSTQAALWQIRKEWLR